MDGFESHKLYNLNTTKNYFIPIKGIQNNIENNK